MPYRIKNWDRFQHYKDRLPPWIKLHRELLNDMRLMALTPADRGNLIMLWVLAAESGGSITDDCEELAWRLRVPAVDLGPLIDAEFLIPDAGEEWENPWPARYIPDSVRAEVMTSAGYKCSICGETKTLEIDHITPISKGGTSDKSNLQVLCRSCNRRKRVAIATPKKSARKPRSLETETEERRDRGEAEERQKRPSADEVDLYIREMGYRGFTGQQFIDHYTANGWKVGRNPMKDWRAAVRTWSARTRSEPKHDTYSGSSSNPGRPCQICGGPWPCKKCFPEES